MDDSKVPQSTNLHTSHEPDGSDEDYCYIQAGRRLSEAEVFELQTRLHENPQDLQARLKLIGYFQNVLGEKRDPAATLEHILWMIDHRPADFVCYTFTLGQDYTQQQYNELEDRWIEQVRRYPDNDIVSGNAGSSISNRNEALSWQYFKRAQLLNPLEPRWTRRLSMRAANKAVNGNQDERERYAQIAIDEALKYFQLDDMRGERIGMHIRLTPVAIEFGYLKQARLWTEWLIELCSNCEYQLWAQQAYLFLAQIEVIEGNSKKSIGMLRKALSSLKSDQPSHVASGHHMLAVLDKLLKNGERKIVIEALKVSTKKGEEEKRAMLQEWLSLIEAGETPTLEWGGRR